MDFGAVSPQESGVVLLESGRSPKFLKGTDLLLQTVVIELCSDPLPSRGGSGFVSSLREIPLGANEGRSIASSRLRIAEENVLRSQRDAALADDERLQSLDLMDFREGTDGWEADIRMIAVSGAEIVRTFT